MEQLIHDCRLLNKASEKGQAKLMRDLLVESDCYLDPQAYIMKPDVVFEISEEIVKTQDPFLRTLHTAHKALEILDRAVGNKELTLDEREENWLEMLNEQIEDIPEDEEKFISEMKEELSGKRYLPEEYGL